MKHLRPQHEHGIGPLFTKYPDAPGYKRAGTSKDAAEEVLGENEKLRQACVECLWNMPRTSDEVAAYLHKSILLIRPRMSELVAQGRIFETVERRKNVSGKSAIVWRAL